MGNNQRSRNSKPGTRNSDGGVVLLLISGIVTLLVLVSLGILQATRILAARAAAQTGAAQASLAAASGMEYAGSRLGAESYPRFNVPASARGDDWRSLDPAGTPEGEWRNPSYPHGEPWTDAGAPDGAYLQGEPYADRDGSGRLDARTGRIRGGGEGLPFSIRIDSIDGKVPVNAGDLSAARSASVADPCLYHRSLEHVLNNLGVVLGLSTGVETIPAGDYAGGNPGQPVLLSHLGADLIQRRPPGGWRDAAHWRTVLSGLGYPKADLDRIEGFIDVGPYETPAEYARDDSGGSYAPISLATASPEVLRSLWTYVCTGWYYLPGPQADWNKPCTWTGDASKPTTRLFQNSADQFYVHPSRCIDPEEAGRLADLAVARRLAGDYSWRSLYQRIAWDAPALFKRDWDDLGGGGLSPVPDVQVRLKADLAFHAVAMDGNPHEGSPYNQVSKTCPSATYLSWGFDRKPSTPETELSFAPFFGYISRIRYPDGYPSLPSTYADPFAPYNGGPQIAPQGLTMSPPCRFRVLCVSDGARAALEGVLRAQERLDFASQEDFENLSGCPRLLARGIEARESDLASARARRDGGAGFPRIWSLPRWSRRTSSPSAYGVAPGYPRNHGALCLAGVEEGLVLRAKYHLPFTEQFDGSSAGPDFPADAPGFPASQCFPQGMDFDGMTFKPPCTFNPFYLSGFGFPFEPPWRKRSLVDVGGYGIDCTVIEEFSLECWMGPNFSNLLVSGITEYGTAFRIGVTSPLRLFEDPDLQYTHYAASISGLDSLGGICAASGSWKIEDREHLLTGESPRFSFGSHVVLTMKLFGSGTPAEPYYSDFRLFVNGRDHPVSGPMTFRLQGDPGSGEEPFYGALRIPAFAYLSFGGPNGGGVDEIRLYDRQLSSDDALALYRLGRHVKRGVYTSPLYALDGPGRLGSAQWTGTTPAKFGVDPFDVRVQGYADRDGMAPVGAAVPLGTLSGDIADLREAMSEVRSLRYLVTIDANGSAGVLNESPIFESIWITLRRRGSAPGWSGWTSR